MCGICGTISLTAATPDASRAEGMLRALVHRGPDSEGRFADSRVAAGIRRLRVIDLETGDQPISNEDGSVTVVFNGEIYNFPDLRRDLEGRGHRFRTRADTEVLVHLWEEHGTAMLDRLDGMFAFCLRDARRDEVLLARDRFGVKPLYYREAEGRIDFASEMRALLAAGGGAPVDEGALVEAFFLQYVPGERTLRRGVRKLLPGWLLHVRRGREERRSWYDLPEPAEQPGDARNEPLGPLLADAVRRQTVADVPLGMFLSGGLDSTVVLALLSRISPMPVETFSVGFEGDPRGGELRYARLAAETFGARHHEVTVSAADVASEIPGLVVHLGAPVLDPALVPTFLLSRAARRDVTVVLTGEGADEVFGGYRRYSYAGRFRAAGRVPFLPALARAPGLARVLPARTPQALDALAERDPARAHFLWSSTVDRATAARLFDEDVLAAAESRVVESFRRHLQAGTPSAAAPLRADLREWLPHNLLAKVDSASMAHSLEARVPYLDPRVVAWASRLPEREKVRGGATKIALREAFAGAIPREILRRPKRGFDLPLDAWIRGPLRGLVEETVRSAEPSACGPIRKPAAVAMLDRHLRGGASHGLPLFLATSILLHLDRARRA